MYRNWKATLQIAATYVGTVVGAGFASGQEILRFFTVHGGIGLIAILINTFLFIWLGGKVMRISKDQGCYSYQELNTHLFGKRFSWIVNGLTLVVLFGTTGVMLSGTGAVFQEQLGLPNQLGIIFTMVLCMVTLFRGLSGILWVNSLVVPTMIVFSGILGFHLYQDTGTESITFSFDSWNWLYSAFLYSGFNLAMAQAVLVPLGKDTDDKKTLKWGAFWGGLTLGFMLLVGHLSLQHNLGSVKELDIPMAYIIGQFGKPMVFLFTFVVFGEIFTTIIGNVFGLVRQAHSQLKLKEPLAALLILLGSFIVSQWGFQSLVSILYPAFGAIGLIFLLRLMLYREKR